MDTIVAPTFKDTEGLGNDGLFLLKRLHSEHSFAIDLIGIAIGEGALGSIGIDNFCLIVMDTFASDGSCLLIQVNSGIALRAIAAGNISRKA